MKALAWIVGAVLILGIAGFAALQIHFARSIEPVEPLVPTAAEREQLAFYSQDESWFIQHLKKPRDVVDGQTLDPKLQYMFEQHGESAKWLARSVIFATPWGRAFLRNKIDREWLLYTKTTPPMAHVEDRTIEGRRGFIPIRIYRPDVAEAGPLPVLVYHHGGGWIFASITALDGVARLIANEARVIVVSVNYRLAPEHPYPAASDDGEDAFLWTLRNAANFGGDPTRVGVGGDSAGGHVSINIAQRQLRAGKPVPAALLLFYPGTGMPQADPSYRMFGQGYDVDAAFIDFILPRVFPNQELSLLAKDDLANPVDAKNLAGLPPTIIATAGFDILRDSGRRFAERLGASAVPVHYTNYPSLAHSFLQFSAIVKDADTASTESARLLGETIRGAHSGPSSP